MTNSSPPDTEVFGIEAETALITDPGIERAVAPCVATAEITDPATLRTPDATLAAE